MIRCVVIIRITNQIIHENYSSSIRSENFFEISSHYRHCHQHQKISRSRKCGGRTAIAKANIVGASVCVSRIGVYVTGIRCVLCRLNARRSRRPLATSARPGCIIQSPLNVAAC